MTGYVCAVDGVAIQRNRLGRLVHTDELPRGVDPDHEIDPVRGEAREREEAERTDLHQLAAELIQHHASIHPVSDCAFATRLAQALRSKR